MGTGQMNLQGNCKAITKAIITPIVFPSHIYVRATLKSRPDEFLCPGAFCQWHLPQFATNVGRYRRDLSLSRHRDM